MDNEALIAELMRLRPRLLRVARSYFGRHAAEAEDAVQEVSLRLWQLRNRLDGVASLEALAVRMVKNVCVDIYRKEQTATFSEEYDAVEPAFRATPQTLLEINEDNRRLEQALNALPRTEARLFRLCRDSSIDIDTLSRLTGVTPRSVSALLSKARRRLWEMLKEK